MNFQNIFTIAFLMIMTTIMSLLTISSAYWFSAYFLSIISASSALVLIAFCCAIASRLPSIEKFLGGLDKMYNLHKWAAIVALILVFVHIVLIKPPLRALRIEPIISVDKIWNWRIVMVCLVLLFVTILLALNRNIRYHIWRWVHKFSMLVLLLAALHWLVEKMPLDFIISPLGLWLLFFSIGGVICGFYKLILYRIVHKSLAYEIIYLNNDNESIIFSMKPLNSHISYCAGSFVFLSFKQKGLREYHPFTISNYDPHHNLLTFIVKPSGDYTKKLKSTLKLGLGVSVSGPYGHFHRPIKNNVEFWFSAGVGITPFLAWLDVLDPKNKVTIIFYYLYKKSNMVISESKLTEICKQKGVDLKILCSNEGQSFNDILLEKDINEKDIRIYFCGPELLKEVIKTKFNNQGYKKVKIQAELYNFR